jgi:hypothetical protein
VNQTVPTAAAVVLPYADAAAMNQHLAAISRVVVPGAHAILVTDGAGYHQKTCLNVPANISILALPPYSPELNPVENVWQYLRQNFLSLRILDDYNAIVDACCQAWNAFINIPGLVASITARDWAAQVSR